MPDACAGTVGGRAGDHRQSGRAHGGKDTLVRALLEIFQQDSPQMK
jgi:hypothetical protein